MDILVKYVIDGFFLTLMLSMPPTLLAAGIGLVVGILQAVTQVQEQTIPAAPKIFFVFLLIILAGPLSLQMMQDYLREGVHIGTEVLPRSEQMVLPAKPLFAYSRPIKNSAQRQSEFFDEQQVSAGPSKLKGIMGQSKNNSIAPATKIPQKTGNMQPRLRVNDQLHQDRQQSGQRNTAPRVNPFGPQ